VPRGAELRSRARAQPEPSAAAGSAGDLGKDVFCVFGCFRRREPSRRSPLGPWRRGAEPSPPTAAQPGGDAPLPWQPDSGGCGGVSSCDVQRTRENHPRLSSPLPNTTARPLFVPGRQPPCRWQPPPWRRASGPPLCVLAFQENENRIKDQSSVNKSAEYFWKAREHPLLTAQRTRRAPAGSSSVGGGRGDVGLPHAAVGDWRGQSCPTRGSSLAMVAQHPADGVGPRARAGVRCGSGRDRGVAGSLPGQRGCSGRWSRIRRCERGRTGPSVFASPWELSASADSRADVHQALQVALRRARRARAPCAHLVTNRPEVGSDILSGRRTSR